MDRILFYFFRGPSLVFSASVPRGSKAAVSVPLYACFSCWSLITTTFLAALRARKPQFQFAEDVYVPHEHGCLHDADAQAAHVQGCRTHVRSAKVGAPAQYVAGPMPSYLRPIIGSAHVKQTRLCV